MFQAVPSLHAGENVRLFIREHWMMLFLKFLIVGFLLAVHVGVFGYGIPTYAPAFLEGDTGIVVSMLSKAYLAILVLFGFLIWVFYYLTLVVITGAKETESLVSTTVRTRC
jgi:uncharacterized membrane protein YcgQ (UPF0703/DUF1980 family)